MSVKPRGHASYFFCIKTNLKHIRISFILGIHANTSYKQVLWRISRHSTFWFSPHARIILQNTGSYTCCTSSPLSSAAGGLEGFFYIRVYSELDKERCARNKKETMSFTYITLAIKRLRLLQNDNRKSTANVDGRVPPIVKESFCR